MNAPSYRALGRRGVLIGLGVALAVGLFFAFQAGRKELAAEKAREAPVVPPTRMQMIGDRPAVVLDSESRRRIGIATQVLTIASQAATVTLTGELVQDPSAVTIVRAPIAGRLMPAPNGQWPTLGQQLRVGQIIGRVSDALPLAAPRPGTVTHVGAQPGEIVQPGQELLTLINYTRVLARVVWTPDAPGAAPQVVSIGPLAAPTVTVRGVLIGPAPEADTLTRSPVFLYRLMLSWADARPGVPIVATLPNTRQSFRGVFVPVAAAVQWNALTWVYEERKPGQFQRVRLDMSTPVPGGWLAQGALAPGIRIVVRGAEELLSQEFFGASSGGASGARAGQDPDAR